MSEPLEANNVVKGKSAEAKLETATKRNLELKNKLNAVTLNYDTLFRQYTALELKWKALQASHVNQAELLTNTLKEKDVLLEQAERLSFKGQYPRNIRTQKIHS